MTPADRQTIRRAAAQVLRDAGLKRLRLLVQHLERLHQNHPDNARFAADLAAYKEALNDPA